MTQTGKTDQKNGEVKLPPFHNTLLAAFKLITFNQQAYYYFALNRLCTYNLVTIFLLMFFIPYKSPSTGEIVFLNLENIVEGSIITGIFMLLVFITVPKKSGWFLSFVRIFLAMELTAVAAPISLLIDKEWLGVFFGFYHGWYISLVAFSLVTLRRFSYLRAGVVALSAFFLAVMSPLFLGA